jgi:hypothetical protein
MNDSSWFFNFRPAYPWSESPIGLPALAIVAILLVALTIWTYTGHPNASRRRIAIVLALRLLALLVALLTAIRPSVGVQEDPKFPSVLIIGVDLSESMTMKDEVNNQARIDAVRKTLEKSQPLLDELAAEQNVSTVIYKFSTPDFDEATSLYAPGDPADGKRSDYGTYFNKSFERWQSERFIRGHLIIGDGADNGESFSAIAEAARWGYRGVPITTFTVGDEGSGSDVKDIIVSSIECDPSPVPIKTDVTVIGTVHAYGFKDSRVVARVFIDGEVRSTEEFTLDKEKDNKIRMTVKAPETRGEIKIKLQVGQERDGEIVPLRGELDGENNQSETYLTVTKDGVRLLVIDRLRWENTLLLDALRSEKRFDVNLVTRQTDLPPTAAEREFLDLDAQAYDVIIIGNVTAQQLQQADPNILEKLAERVKKQGMGLMFLGGEHAFTGMPADLLPVRVVPGQIVENVEESTRRPIGWYQTVPTENGLDKMMKMAKEKADSISLWNDLNGLRSRAKITGYNRMAAPPTSTVYAWVTPQTDTVTAGTRMPDERDPLLVGHQIGDGARGRVLAFGAYDTFLWMSFGQPKTSAGVEIHSRFWKQCVLWLAHQDEEEGQAYIRPALRQLKVGGEQTLRLGVKLPSGGDDPNAELTVKVVPLPEGKAEPDPIELERAKPETIIRDMEGAKVLFRPRVKGEYFVLLTSPKKDENNQPVLDDQGQPVLLRATAKFIAIPDTTDEMLRVSADHDFMTRLSVPNGGKALRLEDLPGFLRELKAEPLPTAKPKPRFYPDWRRNHSKGFLPFWLVIFALLLGTEWGLRRLWGMV